MKVRRLNIEQLKLKSDSQLVDMYKITADRDIVGELYNRYNHIVFGVCLKYLKDTDRSNDALMHIFNELFYLLERYEIRDFKHWLHTTTKNYCFKLLKSNNYSLDLDIIPEKNISQEFMETEQQIAHLEERDLLIEKMTIALETLKPEQKECVKLFYIQSKSYQDVSDITGYDLKKVKSYIQNGKRNLQIIMEKEK